MQTLVFYAGYENRETIQLFLDNNVLDLSSVTKVVINFRNKMYDSDSYPDAFDWSHGDGKLSLKLGLIPNMPAKTDRKTEVIIYDPLNPRGVVWGTIRVRIIKLQAGEALPPNVGSGTWQGSPTTWQGVNVTW